MNEDKKIKHDVDKETETSGEQLLNEYQEQDVDDKHYMGYSVYTRTDSGGCCC